MQIEPTIDRVFLFQTERQEKGKAVCGVSMNYGPINIRARLVQGEKELFLSLPSRKNETSQRYYNLVYVQDANLRRTFEQLATQAYWAAVKQAKNRPAPAEPLDELDAEMAEMREEDLVAA